VIGGPDDFGRILHEKAIDQVMFFSPYDNPKLAQELLKECEILGIPACFNIHIEQPLFSKPKLILMHHKPFFVFDVAPKRPEALALKHTFDALVAAIGIIIISLFLLIISVLVLVTMGKPILFTQSRSGLFGREFLMYKFRTMTKGAENERDGLLDLNEMDGPVFKITDDPRITRLGKFLRRWSIDELPQLFNVLIGDMSLVGPRPLPIKEQRQIRGWKRRRLSMRPGITGLWQVSGRNDVDFKDWMKLDLEYVDKWSLLLDVKILLRTIKVVLIKKGAS